MLSLYLRPFNGIFLVPLRSVTMPEWAMPRVRRRSLTTPRTCSSIGMAFIVGAWKEGKEIDKINIKEIRALLTSKCLKWSMPLNLLVVLSQSFCAAEAVTYVVIVGQRFVNARNALGTDQMVQILRQARKFFVFLLLLLCLLSLQNNGKCKNHR